MVQNISSNSRNLGLEAQNWANMIQKEGALGLKSGAIKHVNYFKNESEMVKNGHRKLNFNEFYRISLSKLKDAQGESVKTTIYTFTAKRIENETQKLQSYANKVNATWVNALKWILIATVILSPLAIIIDDVQHLAKDAVKQTKTLQKELDKAYVESLTPEDLAKIVKKDLKPLIPKNPNQSIDVKNLFISLVEGSSCNINPIKLTDQSDILVPTIVKLDLPRTGLIQLNDKTIFSLRDLNLQNPENAYREINQLFQNYKDPNAITNAVLVAITQASMPHIIEALTYVDAKDELHLCIGNKTTGRPHAISIQIEKGIIDIRYKSIFPQAKASDAENPEKLILISQNMRIPISELEEAIDTDNMDKLKNFKGEVLASESIPLSKKDDFEFLQSLVTHL